MTTPSLAAHRSPWPWLLLLAAFGLRFGTAVLLPTVHRPDEIFQNLEPAYRILTGHGILTWEWQAGIRSPLYPAALAGIMGLARLLGAGPAFYLGLVTAALAFVSLGTVAVSFDLGRRQARLAGGLACGVLCATWPDLVYFGPKPLAEIQAGNLLVIAAYLAMRAAPSGTGAPPRPWLLPATGLMLGLALCIRFHLAPALLLVAIWAARLQPRRWLLLAAGGLAPVLAYGAADAIAWGIPFVSLWRSIHANVVQAIAAEYGVQPFTWYGSQLIGVWSAALVPLLITFLEGLRRAPLLAAVAAAVVLSHAAIAHKEISFIYAAIPPMLVVCGLGSLELAARFAAPPIRWPGACAAVAAFWAATAFTTALGGGYEDNWYASSGIIRAEQAVRTEPDLCGLGFQWPAVFWPATGGEVVLGRAIPMYTFGTPEGTARVAPAINFAIGGTDVAARLPGFTVQACWNNPNGPVCLARTARNTCQPIPNLELNNVPDLGRKGTVYGSDPPTAASTRLAPD